VNRGYYISVSGLVCKTPAFATQLREAAKAKLLPLDRLMVETDAPYMGFSGCRALCADKPKKSHPNVPSALPMIVRALADIMDVDASELAQASSRNAEAFFGIRVERSD
jgi:TatD DNase family protein